MDETVAATIDQLELKPHRKKLARNLSGGMKRKLCVAIALIGDPEVVLLDEVWEMILCNAVVMM